MASVPFALGWSYASAAGEHSLSRPAARGAPRQHEARLQIRRRPVCPAPPAVRPLIARASASTGLSPALLVAVARTESRFDPDAVSQAGARGLFQLMPETAAAFKIDASEPAANALGGARYLREMLRRFGDLDLALSAYNAGPTAVERAGGAPSIGVLRYALTVERQATHYAGCTLSPASAN